MVKICTALVQDIRTLAEIFECVRVGGGGANKISLSPPPPFPRNPFDTIKELNVTRVAIRTYDAVLAGRTKVIFVSPPALLFSSLRT